MLVQEAACLSFDAALQGTCRRVELRVIDSLTVEIIDDGPGIGVCADPSGKRWPTLLMTALFACRDAK